MIIYLKLFYYHHHFTFPVLVLPTLLPPLLPQPSFELLKIFFPRDLFLPTLEAIQSLFSGYTRNFKHTASGNIQELNVFEILII